MIRQLAEIKGHNEPSEKENHIMVKKHTLFFDTNFRKAKEKCAPEAIEAALNLAARITKLSVIGFQLHYNGTGLEKFFDGTHYESQSLYATMEKAARIETLIYIGPNYSVWVDVSFFKKGQKDVFYELGTAFSKEGCSSITVFG